ncbi:MAG: ABC transporter substrate-binding protein [Proteobacteria bacterium]|nr:ABC transporter substrate-binding protein [Pseudomonadota bacterium]
MISRRKTLGALALAGTAVAWPRAVFAQQGDRIARIGVLMSTAESDPESQSRVAALAQQLRDLGWVDGRNAKIEYRWTDADPARTRDHAKELVALRPEVIAVQGPVAVDALLQETRTIPIVFILVSDPIGRGFASSLAKPGGTVTGFTNVEPMAAGKYLEVLKEIAPRVAYIAVLFDPLTTPAGGLYMPSIEAAAASLRVDVKLAPARTADEAQHAIHALGDDPGWGLVVLPNPVTEGHRKAVIDLAARYRLPAIYPYPQYAADGGLVSFGIDAKDTFRRAAAYVDRILRGEKPGELPIQQPTKFDLTINLKTAKALGLTISLPLLGRADEVIE